MATISSVTNIPVRPYNKRTLSTETQFSDLKELFQKMQIGLPLQNDLQIGIRAKPHTKSVTGVVGERSGVPFILTQSDKLLGKGGYGSVHEGRLYRLVSPEEWSEEPVAIKHSRLKRNFSEFRWEIKVSEKIGDIENVQKILMHYRFENSMGLVSILREGTAMLVADKSFQEKSKSYLSAMIALEQILLKGFYYTDIKPANFLLKPDNLEVIDLSSTSYLSTTKSSKKALKELSKIVDSDTQELLFNVEFRYLSEELWEALKENGMNLMGLKDDKKGLFKERAAFKSNIENLMGFCALMAFFELTTSQLPSECPTRIVSNKNPILSNAEELLVLHGAPAELSAQFVSYLKLAEPLSLRVVINFLTKCQESA